MIVKFLLEYDTEKCTTKMSSEPESPSEKLLYQTMEMLWDNLYNYYKTKYPRHENPYVPQEEING